MANPDINSYTAAQLQAMRAQIKEEDLDAAQKVALRQLDALIAQKVAEEAIDRREAAAEFRARATKLDAKAKALYPELKDDKTEFSKRVNEYLEAMGTATTDPGALLNAATLVADELGIEPVTTKAPKIMKVGGSGGSGGGEPEEDDFLGRTKDVGEMFKRMGLNLDDEKVKNTVLESAKKTREDSDGIDA